MVKAKIKYTDCMDDKQIVLDCLAKNQEIIILKHTNINGIYWGYIIKAKDYITLMNFVADTNKKTTYGLSLEYCKETITDRIFSKKKHKK